MARSAIPAKIEPNLIRSFARTQITHIKFHDIRESSFLELAVCAFFRGAETLLTKQGGVDPRLGRAQLVSVISMISDISTRNANELIDTVDHFSGKYALIENIIDQGASTADKWITCEEMEGGGLFRIVKKYKNLTMFDLGIEGVNAEHEASQRALYETVDQSVGRMRRRALLIILGIAGVCAVAFLAILKFWPHLNPVFYRYLF